MAVATLDRKKKERAKASKQGPRVLVDFTAAAHEHVEPAFDVTQATQAATSVTLGPFDVPAYGYLRHIDILVTVSVAGALGTGVLHEDFPFNILDEVTLLDVNGAPIYGPVTGFDTFLVNLYGAYVFATDPRSQPDFSATYATAAFMLRIPVEIQHNNGLGALANQNAAASYKVRLVLSALSTQLSTVGSATVNTYRIRGFLEAWSQPTSVDLAGRPQAMQPPRHGTTQYWSKFIKSVSAGAQTIQLPRVGNLIRTIIFILRTATVRTTTDFPDPIELWWDARQLIVEPRFLRRTYMVERYLHASGGILTGAFSYPLTHDVLGHAGDGTPELWLPTVQSTRLELRGTFGAGAVSLAVLTNDVAPVEVQPQERYQEQSETGFTPESAASPVAG